MRVCIFLPNRGERAVGFPERKPERNLQKIVAFWSGYVKISADIILASGEADVHRKGCHVERHGEITTGIVQAADEGGYAGSYGKNMK